MSSEAKKYDEWIKHQMVNLLEAILTHNSTKLEQSLGKIEHGLSFAEDMSPNLVDLAIKFQALLRIYRTEKTTDPVSPWAWVATQSTSASSQTVDLMELKSALGSRKQKKKEEHQRKQEKAIKSLSGSIKDLQQSDEDEY